MVGMWFSLDIIFRDSHSGMRLLAQARNPYSLSWLWIPGSRFARPGMTEFCNSRKGRIGLNRTCNPRQQPFLDRLDLQRQIFRVDTALREAAGDEPQAGLAGARIHVAQLLGLAKPPDRADASDDLLAEQFPNQFFLAFVSGREHDQIGGKRFAALHPRAVGDKTLDIGKLLQGDLAFDDQIGAADIEIIAAAASEIFELPAGVAVAEIELEARAREAIEQFPVQSFRALGNNRMAFPGQRKRHRGSDEIVVLQRAF